MLPNRSPLNVLNLEKILLWAKGCCEVDKNLNGRQLCYYGNTPEVVNLHTSSTVCVLFCVGFLFPFALFVFLIVVLFSGVFSKSNQIILMPKPNQTLNILSRIDKIATHFKE